MGLRGSEAAANRMHRRDFVLGAGHWTAIAVGMALLGGCEVVNSLKTTTARVRRVGFLASTGGSLAPAFQDALVRLG